MKSSSAPFPVTGGTQNRLQLSAVLSDNPNTRPLLRGLVQPDGVTLITTARHPSEMFWRQLHFGEFDISEMSLSSLIIATAQSPTDWVAIPVFTTREFYHTRILVRSDAGIAVPADLKGKRIGVPEYQQTAAIWARGVLEQEFGVRPSDVEWFMERLPEKSHGGATGFQAPDGVTVNQIGASSSIGDMLANGELDATLRYLKSNNLVDRSRIDVLAAGIARPLFPDVVAEGRRYYAKTGVYPINHTVVIRRSLLERHPWLALNLFAAFTAARQVVVTAGQEFLAPFIETGVAGADLGATLARDCMPYGMTAARETLRLIASLVHEQGLSRRLVDVDELFAPSTLDI